MASKRLYIVVYTKDGQEFFIGGIYTSQTRATNKRVELNKAGYEVRINDVEANEDLELHVNTTDFMIHFPAATK